MSSEQDELTEQGKLILEFERICPFLEFSIYERIANFILSDRKRIVEPLTEMMNYSGNDTYLIAKAVHETIKRAGVL